MKDIKDHLRGDYSATYDIEAPAAVVATPSKAAYSCQSHFQKILSTHKIHFAYNKAMIKKESYSLLDSLADIAKKCPKEVITIAGHTDSDGKKAYNLKLSTNRANAVKNYLAKQGIPLQRLEAKGYGESKPIASNKTKKGKAQNRRIEFIIKGAK